MSWPQLTHAVSAQSIARTGTGVDNVDHDAATERGILVTNTPTRPTRCALTPP